MSRQQIHEQLQKLLPGQFDAVVFHYRMPHQHQRRDVTLEQQIQDLIIYAEQWTDGLEKLWEVILFVQTQPIFAQALPELKLLLQDAEIDDSTAFSWFRQTVPDSRLPDTCANGNFFTCCLDFLAKKPHTPPEQAPLLTFLEYCRPGMPAAVLPELSAWQENIAQRLDIDLANIRANAGQTAQVATETPVILLKIAPDKLTSDDRFVLKAWLHHHGNYQPLETPDDTFQRDTLENVIPEILRQAARKSGSALRLEVILPLVLFDWNPGRIPLKAGPLKTALGKLYPLSLRSWDRLYHSDYDFVRHYWPEKWQPGTPLQSANLHCIFSDPVCCETLFGLLRQNAQVFLALFSLPENAGRRQEMFGTALAAGLAFAFWPLLITGPPGVGKSSLAHAAACQLGLDDVLQWPVTSKSVRQDGLYQYDALARLQEAALLEKQGRQDDTQAQSKVADIGRYITLSPLGTAFLRSTVEKPAVVLIDELDKSDIDLPNDLLHLFEEGEFEIPEIARLPENGETDEVQVYAHNSRDKLPVSRDGLVQCEAFPLVIMTSNGEREFPPAFLRRCLRLRIAPPDAEALRTIVARHLELTVPADSTAELTPQQQKSLELLQEFLARRDQKHQSLATDQLLNAMYLFQAGVDVSEHNPALREAIFEALTEG